MSKSEKFLLFSLVDNESKAESVRKIRNQCRNYMTRNNNYISKTNQKKWFHSSIGAFETFLVGAIEDGVIYIEVGYGLIKIEPNIFYLTAALVPTYRGMGHGNEIFNFLIKRCKSINPGKKILLEVKSDNFNAIKLYRKLGFITINEDEFLTVMELKGK